MNKDKAVAGWPGLQGIFPIQLANTTPSLPT